MALFGLACLTGCPVATPSLAQLLAFPATRRPIPERRPAPVKTDARSCAGDQLRLPNERVSAVGNVQLYYGASTLEADRVIYDQKTKRLHAEGNVRLTQPDGTVTYGEIMDLSDDFLDGFVDSLRADAPEQTRFAANRAERSGSNFTVFHSGVYTACEPCKDDPTKPPKWQVKAERIVHDQTEKMMYFESARLELAGVPFAYVPYFSAPDPTVKRKTGFLVPSYSTSSVYGFGVSVPYYLALAPDYDVTFTPMITSRQGPVLQGEWRQRLMDGSYTIRATGVFQLDKVVFPTDSADIATGAAAWNCRYKLKIATNGFGAGMALCCRTEPFVGLRPAHERPASSDLPKLVPDFALSQALYCRSR
jgi:LPS-assembly protein